MFAYYKITYCKYIINQSLTKEIYYTSLKSTECDT